MDYFFYINITFFQSTYEARIPSDITDSDAVILSVSARDPDDGINAELIYVLSDTNVYFTMDVKGTTVAFISCLIPTPW